MAGKADTGARGARQEGGMVRFVVLLALVAVFLRSFVFATFSIPTGSMLPKLMVGDYLVVSKWDYGWSRYSLPFHIPLIAGRLMGRLPERGDIVVFKYPGPSKIDYVKRVIGLPGDRIAVTDGVLSINGRAVPRTRIADWAMPVSANSPCRAIGDDVRDRGARCFYPRYRESLPGGRVIEVLDHGAARFDTTGEYRVPPRHLFMMGDNRDDSLDSRAPVADNGVGLVPLDHLVGRARFGYLSMDGSARLSRPGSWLGAVRWDRIGTAY